LLIRVPSVFVAAAVGAGVMVLTGWQLLLIFLGLGAVLVLFLWQQDRLLTWAEQQAARVLQRS
jgi:ABC-type bacteriocin/lantibiotic exporter with double-glycine peptidase domain